MKTIIGRMNEKINWKGLGVLALWIVAAIVLINIIFRYPIQVLKTGLIAFTAFIAVGIMYDIIKFFAAISDATVQTSQETKERAKIVESILLIIVFLAVFIPLFRLWVL